MSGGGFPSRILIPFWCPIRACSTCGEGLTVADSIYLFLAGGLFAAFFGLASTLRRV
jgi:hypothetical protein